MHRPPCFATARRGFTISPLPIAALGLVGVLACGGRTVAQLSPDGGQGSDLGNGGLDGAAMGPGCPASPATRPPTTPSWSSISGLRNPQSWYVTPVAAYVADNILYYQNSNGGWPKNIDMTLHYGVDAGSMARNTKSMIDNSATTTQVRYLAYMLGSWPMCERFQNGFNAGLGFLFKAQYPASGGWPQVWPVEVNDYSRHITYNDNAMVHVLQILRDIAYKDGLFKFVSAATVDQATAALRKGVDCVLKTQIVAAGRKTGWCAQHDAGTLQPVNARAYELASQSGKEGAQVLSFLMTLDLSRADVPKQDVIDAVEGAALFYDSVKILGYRYVQGPSDAGPSDSWIEALPNAPALWARFYDLEPPFRPFFSGRDGHKVYSLAEIEIERRGGYSWYVTDATAILSTTYPAWALKWTAGRNVLATAHADAGAAPDATAPAEDASAADHDGPVPEQDASVPDQDSSVPEQDAGASNDGGVSNDGGEGSPDAAAPGD